MNRYEIRSNLSPEIHTGSMKYYAQVVMVNAQGTFTVHHEWKSNYMDAVLKCETHARKQGWLK